MAGRPLEDGSSIASVVVEQPPARTAPGLLFMITVLHGGAGMVKRQMAPARQFSRIY
jgi:hypothetical protein